MVRWRPCGATDDGFCLDVFSDVRKELLGMAALPDAAVASIMRMQYLAQLRDYGLRWPQSQACVIEWVEGGAPLAVGRLWFAREALAIQLLDIAVLRAYRGRGIGQACLRRLQALARRMRLPIHLQVQSHARARRLYERMGFAGPIDAASLDQFMSWRAVDPGAASDTGVGNGQA